MGSGLPTFMIGKSIGEYVDPTKAAPKEGQQSKNIASSLPKQATASASTTSKDSMMSTDYYFSEPTSADCSSISSYTSLGGFETLNGKEKNNNPKADVNPQLLQKLELQGKISEIVQKILKFNSQLFIRQYALSEEDQIKIFGEPVLNVNEVLSAVGCRVLLIGRIDFWTNCCNLNEHPVGQELQRYSFVNEDGEKIFQCSLFNDVMKINMGTLFIGQLILRKQIHVDCSEWDLSSLIVEDRYSDQVLRFERNKTQFDVLLYPEQLKICQVASTRWNPKQFSFLTTEQRVFGIPLPDEFALTLRKKVLLLTSSIYLYDKYYHKSKKCRIVIGVFAIFSVLVIGALIVLERMGLFQPST